MSSCETCASKGKCNQKECNKLQPKYGKIKNIIGVISGKGGVGKSTVTGILAIELKKAGYSVGIIDGDITGPSMPRFFGINKKRADIYPVNDNEVKFSPVITSLGIKVISLNLLTEEEEQPVIWRGPVITGVLTQMYTDTDFGDLDFLLIDMPPGTGDIALTIMQSLPLTGMVVVSTPQDMVTMIVKKVINMCKKMNVNIFGVVENMSYITCGKCHEKIRIFSKRTAEEEANALETDLLMEMPINLDMVEAMEKGEAEKYINEINDYKALKESLLKKLN